MENAKKNETIWMIFKHCEPVFYGSPEIEGGKKVRRAARGRHEPEEDLNGVQRLSSNSPSKKSPF